MTKMGTGFGRSARPSEEVSRRAQSPSEEVLRLPAANLHLTAFAANERTLNENKYGKIAKIRPSLSLYNPQWPHTTKYP